jgi:hypothetical protein
MSGDHALVHPDAELTAVPLPPPTLVAAPHDHVTPFEHPESDLDAHPPDAPDHVDADEHEGAEPVGPVTPLAASDE